MTKTLDALVFDFDGVLVDSVEVKAKAFGALYLEHGQKVVDRVMAHHRENGGMTRREKLRHWHSAFLDIDLDDTDLEKLCAWFSAVVVDQVAACPEISGAMSFLQFWSTRVPCLVNSASPDEELVSILKRRGLMQYLRKALGSTQSKEKNLASLLESYRLTPNRVVFFGDAACDLKAASACGTRFIGILPSPDAPLARQHPDIVWFSNFHEVQTHFGQEKLK